MICSDIYWYLTLAGPARFCGSGNLDDRCPFQYSVGATKADAQQADVADRVRSGTKCLICFPTNTDHAEDGGIPLSGSHGLGKTMINRRMEWIPCWTDPHPVGK